MGRLAPSPTGFLHAGHARTFWVAHERARTAGGKLLLRNDDLDAGRCRKEFVEAMVEDLRWLGCEWDGEMVSQSERLGVYRGALEKLRRAGVIYPCARSRKDVEEAVGAPHEGAWGDEPVFPVEWRWKEGVELPTLEEAGEVNWRFRVPEGEELEFIDGNLGRQAAVAGREFGDFLVWRKDGVPSYQLACAVDDMEMGITEVVRGADLVKSTFRQMLVMRGLGVEVPAYYHCELVVDAEGKRLAKRHDGLAVRRLREKGMSPETVRSGLGINS